MLGAFGIGVERLERFVYASLLTGRRNRIVTRLDCFSIGHYLDRS